MKKIVSSLLCTVALAGAAFAQGSVTWSSIAPNAMTGATNSTVLSSFIGGGAAPAQYGNASGSTQPGALGSTFFYALLYNAYTGSQAAAPTTLGQLSTWSDSGLRATNSNSAGRLTPVAGSTQVTVPWASGTTQSVMMVGWSANMGATYAAAIAYVTANSSSTAAFFGVSATGYIAPNSANPGNAVFGTSATSFGLPILSVNTPLNLVVTVPEPGTMALAGLGGLAMLSLRRKK